MKFEFNEKAHRYTLDGKPLTGVTTILGVIAKPALIQWAADQATSYVKQNLKDIAELDDVLKEARIAHRKKKKEAGDIGTEVHNAIESYIKDGFMPEFEGKKKKMFDNFIKWADENIGEFIESERRLYSQEHWFAGTVDMVFKDKDGRVWIGDIKTSKAVYPEYFAQMGGYQVALEEMDGDQDVYGYVVIRLGKDGSFEVVGFNDTKTCRDMFLAANTIYKTKNNLKI